MDKMILYLIATAVLSFIVGWLDRDFAPNFYGWRWQVGFMCLFVSLLILVASVFWYHGWIIGLFAIAIAVVVINTTGTVFYYRQRRIDKAAGRTMEWKYNKME